MKNYLKSKVFYAFTTPLFYVSAFIFNLITPLYFFYFKNFFGGAGTTDLYNFFFFVPVILSLIIPLLNFNDDNNIFEEMFPFSIIQKKIVRLETQMILLFIIILPQILLIPCLNLFGNVDYGVAFCGFLMLVIYSSSAVSLCIFIDVLVNEKKAALIVNILILFALNFINYFSIHVMNIPLLLFFIKSFSLSWHFDSALKGIVDTRDVFFYLCFTVIFLFCSCFFETIKKGKVFSKKQKIHFFNIFVFFILILLNSSRYYIRKDISASHKISVSKYSRNLFSQSDDRISITYYKSRLLETLYPQTRDISDYLKELSLNRNIIYQEKNADDTETMALLKDYGIYGRQFQTVGKNRTEYASVYSTIILEYMGRWEIIPFILSANSIEYDLDIRLLNLIHDKRFIVNVICGNGKTLEKDYSYVIPWLNSQGFICNEINLADEIMYQLKYSNQLIVFGSDSLTLEQCNQIESFIKAGGSLFAAVSRYNVDIENSWYVSEPENSIFINMLEKYGFGFGKNIIADVACSRITMQSDENENGEKSSITQNINYPLWISAVPQKNAVQGITLYWPEELESLNEDVIPLVVSSSNSWQIEPDEKSADTLFLTNPFGIQALNWNDPKSTNNLILASRKNKIIVVPDQNFVNSLTLGYSGGTTGDYRNLDLLVTSLLRLSENEELASLHEKSFLSNNNSFYKIYDEQSFLSACRRTFLCMFVFVPFLIFGMLIFISFMRIQKTNKLLKDLINER